MPVIGLVQVGSQARADRYTYVPLIGMFIMIAWGAADYVKSRNLSKKALWIPALAVLAALTFCSWKQIGYWQNSIKLYQHTLAVTSRNYMAHHLLGQTLIDKGRLDEAIMHYREILKAEPNDIDAHTRLGVALAAKGELKKAISHYKKALENKPDHINALVNLGVALGAQGNLDEAISHFRHVLSLEPENAPAHYNLGFALKLQGKLDEAITHLQESMSIDPKDGRAETMLKTLMQEQNSETPDEEN